MKSSQQQDSSSSKVDSLVKFRIRKSSRINRKLIVWLGIILGLGSSAIALVTLERKLEASIPESVADVSSYARPNTLTIKAKDGSILKEIGEVSHEKIKLQATPDYLAQAFVASEDERFFQHNGVDPRGIARAIVVNVKAQDTKEGASTITQQLARMAYLTQEKKIWRKLKEMKIASKIEANLSKNEILETYLNLAYLGAGSYGVADAAWVYFAKTPQELTLSEAATLAGVVPAPSVYSPFRSPELARQRRNLVLSRMLAAGYITEATATAAQQTPLVTNRRQPRRLQRKSQYFTNYIEEELPKYVAPEILAQGGIVVETTLDPLWQTAAETSVSYGLDKYSKWQKFSEAAIVALDPKTGAIKAMVGGKDFGDNQYNRVTQAQRQPGSTFKPFVYATAIAGGFSPYKSYLDSEFSVDGYKPKNYNKRYRESYVTIYDALKTSINTVALQTILDVGGKPVVQIAEKMGIKSPMEPTYSLSLGSWEVNLLELTSAYGTFANQGKYLEGHGITKIKNRQGEVIYQADFQPQEAIDSDTAAMMTWMMQGVVNSGTGIPAQIGRPSAGKTGTTDEARDLWYVGYIPQVAAGVWLGNDDNTPTDGTSGVAAEMWRKFMLQILQDMPVETFPSRPKLAGREVTVTLEPFKPKKKYHVRQRRAPVYTRNNRYRRPGNGSAQPTVTQKRATPRAASSASTKVNTAPASGAKQPQPFIPKHNKKFNPAYNSDRDWVKERLGR